MPRGELDVDFAASAAALSGIYGCQRAADKLGISYESVKKYRRYFAENPTLQPLVQEKRSALEREWVANLTGAIESGIDFLQRASDQADPKDPDAIHAIAGAVKILTEVGMNRRILDARLARQGGQAGEASGSRSGSSNGVEPH